MRAIGAVILGAALLCGAVPALAARGESGAGIRPALHPASLRCSSLEYSLVFSVVAPCDPGASPPSVLRPHFHHGLLAQMELGVIKGRVVDEAGKPMQGVVIRLIDVGRGREVTITTDKDGRFYRRGMQVGGYELKVEHQGYQPVSNTIKIGGGTDSVFDFSLAKAAAGGSKEFQEGVAAFNAKDYAGAAAKFEAAIAQNPTVAAATRQPGAGLLPVEAAGRGRRQPGEGGALRPPTTRRSSSSWAAPTWTRRPTTRRWPRCRRA